jgi:hypothetical protein
MLTCLTLTRSIVAYIDWQCNPVMTTVTTTGYPIGMLSFPGITICSHGYLEQILFAALFRTYGDFMKLHNGNSFRGLPNAPIQMATYYAKQNNENVTYQLKPLIKHLWC